MIDQVIEDVQAKVLHTYKARRVVIPHSFGITIGLQQGVGSNDLVLQRPLSFNIVRENERSSPTGPQCELLSRKAVVSYLHFVFLLLLSTSNWDGGEVLDDTLGVHSLSSTRFSTGYRNTHLIGSHQTLSFQCIRLNRSQTYVIKTDWFSLSVKGKYDMIDISVCEIVGWYLSLSCMKINIPVAMNW